MATIDISPGRKIIDGVNNQIQLIERRLCRAEEIGVNTMRDPLEHRGELREANRFPGKLACRSAPDDNIFDCILGHLFMTQWLNRKKSLFSLSINFYAFAFRLLSAFAPCDDIGLAFQ